MQCVPCGEIMYITQCNRKFGFINYNAHWIFPSSANRDSRFLKHFALMNHICNTITLLIPT